MCAVLYLERYFRGLQLLAYLLLLYAPCLVCRDQEGAVLIYGGGHGGRTVR
jgi:hypothetical protein